MFSLKTVLQNAVVQGRRVILESARPKAQRIQEKGTPFLHNSNKLSERTVQSGFGRSTIETRGSISSISSVAVQGSRGGSIANLLRPLTTRFIQGLFQKVSNPLWAETRRRTIKRLFGETAPYFALVGVTLVAGPDRGFLTAQDEIEALCGGIREAISRAGWIHNPDYWKKSNNDFDSNEQVSLSNFELGSIIDKGCNAVVYAARWNEDKIKDETDEVSSSFNKNTKQTVQGLSSDSLWSLNHIQLLQSDVKSTTDESVDSNENLQTLKNSDDCGLNDIEEPSSSNQSSLDDESNLMSIDPSSSNKLDLSPNKKTNLMSIGQINTNEQTQFDPPDNFATDRSRKSSLSENVDLLLSTGGFKKNKMKKVRFKDVFAKKNLNDEEDNSPLRKKKLSESMSKDNKKNIETYPLAIKMMFNYEAESNAPAILSTMYKELLPARNIRLDQEGTHWKEKFLKRNWHLSPHRNIVEMPFVFVDRIAMLEGCLDLYPEALPKRLYPGGFGRNMSLFCVMNRYDCSLSDYLSQFTPSTRTSLLLFSQLLEGILHLNKNDVAHRDLKSDNLLLCLKEGWDEPRLVVTDFGCCLCDPSTKMKVSFTSYEADPRMGNAALMAPEVKNAVPGMLSSINFSRSDLWSGGTLAYEIFGLYNPFLMKKNNRPLLDSASYKEAQLPKMPKGIPSPIRRLVYDLLRRNPRQRPSPVVAATITQLALWAPNKWLNRHSFTMPSHNEVTQWLLCLSTKALCEAGTSQSSGVKLEYEIVSTFLSRIRYDDILQAIRWIRAF